MNLQAIVAGFVGTINPPELLVVRVSTGAVKNADASRVPTYREEKVWGNVQPMQYNDILQADSMNIQGVRSKFYLNGQVEGLVRGKQAGGDTITTPDGRVWLVALVTEAWPDWTAGIVTLQDGS